jgi:hypothetical protein
MPSLRKTLIQLVTGLGSEPLFSFNHLSIHTFVVAFFWHSLNFIAMQS